MFRFISINYYDVILSVLPYYLYYYYSYRNYYSYYGYYPYLLSDFSLATLA